MRAPLISFVAATAVLAAVSFWTGGPLSIAAGVLAALHALLVVGTWRRRLPPQRELAVLLEDLGQPGRALLHDAIGADAWWALQRASIARGLWEFDQGFGAFHDSIMARDAPQIVARMVATLPRAQSLALLRLIGEYERRRALPAARSPY